MRRWCFSNTLLALPTRVVSLRILNVSKHHQRHQHWLNVSPIQMWSQLLPSQSLTISPWNPPVGKEPPMLPQVQDGLRRRTKELDLMTLTQMYGRQRQFRLKEQHLVRGRGGGKQKLRQRCRRGRGQTLDRATFRSLTTTGGVVFVSLGRYAAPLL